MHLFHFPAFLLLSSLLLTFRLSFTSNPSFDFQAFHSPLCIHLIFRPSFNLQSFLLLSNFSFTFRTFFHFQLDLTFIFRPSFHFQAFLSLSGLPFTFRPSFHFQAFLSLSGLRFTFRPFNFKSFLQF